MDKKLCVDCKHCIRGPIYNRLDNPYCGLTKRVYPSSNLVTGGPDIVFYARCDDERAGSGAWRCGEGASSFEPKPKRFPRLRRLIGR